MKITLECEGVQYFIDADGSNFTLYKVGKNPIFIGHYTNVANAIKRLLKTVGVGSDDTLTLAEYVEKVDSVGNHLAGQLASIDL